MTPECPQCEGFGSIPLYDQERGFVVEGAFIPCPTCGGNPMTNEANKAAAALLGRSGGRAGRGAAKRRGDSAYYSKLSGRRRINLLSHAEFAGMQAKQAIADPRCGPDTVYLWAVKAARMVFNVRPELRQP